MGRDNIMYVADLHLDLRHPDLTDAAGKYLREKEGYGLVKSIVAAVDTNDVGALVLCGDLAHRPNPRTWAYRAMLSLGRMLTKRGVQVVAFRGNHDGTDIAGRQEFGEVCFGESYYKTPQTIDVLGRKLLVLPWFGRGNVAALEQASRVSVADQHRYMAEAVERIVASERPDIVATHFTVTGASYSSEAQPLLGDTSEFMLPAMFLAPGNVQYAVSGHVHKPQLVNGNIFYPGSAVNCDFGESHEPGFLLDDGMTLDSGKGLPALCPLNNPERLRLVTVEVTVDDAGAGLWQDYPKDGNEIVRLRADVPTGDVGTRAVADMQARLAKTALHVVRPVVTRRRAESRVAHNMRPEQSPTEVLEQFFALVGGEFTERASNLLALHKEVEASVACND